MKYADRVVAARQKYLDIGTQFGAQRMADLVSIALNDPSVMGKNALGAERLGRVFERKSTSSGFVIYWGVKLKKVV